MASPHWSVNRLREEIELLGARGLPRDEYFAQLAPRLRRVIDNDASCWHTLDPHTRLMTSDEPAELVEHGIFTAESATTAGELLVRSEYLVPDSNTFAELAARRIPVGTLDQATRGHPERSARYRDLLEPSGIPHELRAAFVIRGRVWGAVHIARRAPEDVSCELLCAVEIAGAPRSDRFARAHCARPKRNGRGGDPRPSDNELSAIKSAASASASSSGRSCRRSSRRCWR